MKFLIGIISIMLMLVSCANKPTLTSNLQTLSESSLSSQFLEDDNSPSLVVSMNVEVRPGFLIKINSSLDSKLNVASRVGADGNLYLPYGVSIPAAGMSLKSLTDKLNDRYKRFYKNSPNISVQIAEKKYFIEVRGLVKKPGNLLVGERDKIEEIIKKSGELSLDGEARVMQIRRGNNTYYIDLDEYFQGLGLNRSPRWFGGEKVFFMKASTALGGDSPSNVQMLGDVRMPGGMAFKEKADFYHYFVKAGGSTPTSDLSRVQVIRLTPKGREVTSGSAEEISQHIKIEPGDTIMLGSSMPDKFERNIQSGSMIANIISALGILFLVF